MLKNEENVLELLQFLELKSLIICLNQFQFNLAYFLICFNIFSRLAYNSTVHILDILCVMFVGRC